MLTWLVNQVKILADRIIAAANNAYYWAVSKANTAYNNAVAWAKGKVDSLTSTVWNLYQAAKNHATNLLSGITSTIKYWYDRAVAGAKALVKGAIDQGKKLFDAAKAFAKTLYDRAVAGAKTLVKVVASSVIALRDRVLVWIVENYNRLVAWAQGIVNVASDIFNGLINQLKVEFEEFKASVGLDRPEWMSLLLQFLQNPGRFILAFVWNFFMPFLEWGLAYAIGTTIDPLPPLPDWFEDGYGGGIIPGIGPPPGASGLSPPLDHVYVSGYTFGPGHPGIDLGLVMGAKVYTMHSGIVEISKWSTIGYGFYVTVKSDEWWTLYGHLELLNVRPGQRVDQRDVIGLGNSTGNSTGPHLHLEIKHRGTYIDPLTVL